VHACVVAEMLEGRRRFCVRCWYSLVLILVPSGVPFLVDLYSVVSAYLLWCLCPILPCARLLLVLRRHSRVCVFLPLRVRVTRHEGALDVTAYTGFVTAYAAATPRCVYTHARGVNGYLVLFSGDVVNISTCCLDAVTAALPRAHACGGGSIVFVMDYRYGLF